MGKSNLVGKGSPCKKCNVVMNRFSHGDKWKPKAGQPYFFWYWDCCPNCHHFQHYEEAKCSDVASWHRKSGATLGSELIPKTKVENPPNPPEVKAPQWNVPPEWKNLFHQVVMAVINSGQAHVLNEFPDVLSYFGSQNPADEVVWGDTWDDLGQQVGT